MSNFASWEEALPFAVRIARSLARRQPYALDVDSLVMEALWRAQVSGAVLSRGYVYLRVTGAVKDEMRRVAEGQRGNYQDVGAFVDVDDQFDLGAEGTDLVEAIDQGRTLEALPEAARFLVHETVVVGKSQEEIARDYRVSAPRMWQVLERLKANPASVVRVPGRVDLRGELQRAARQFLEQAIAGTTTSAELARRIGAPKTTAHRWVGPDRPLPTGIIEGRGGPLQAHLHQVGVGLVEKAFERADNSVPVAARLLGCSVMTARRWWRQLPRSAVDRRVRPDLSTAEMLALRGQGLSAHQIGKRLGCSSSAVRWRMKRLRAPT